MLSFVISRHKFIANSIQINSNKTTNYFLPFFNFSIFSSASFQVLFTPRWWRTCSDRSQTTVFKSCLPPSSRAPNRLRPLPVCSCATTFTTPSRATPTTWLAGLHTSPYWIRSSSSRSLLPCPCSSTFSEWGWNFKRWMMMMVIMMVMFIRNFCTFVLGMGYFIHGYFMIKCKINYFIFILF